MGVLNRIPRRKAIPLLILALLVATLPSVGANPDIETLWSDSYVDNHVGWTVVGSPPYLGDTDGDYIYSKTDLTEEGDYGFADLSSAGSITSVTLYLECYGDDAPNDDSFDVYVFDGSSWTNEGNIAPSTTAWGTYETLDLSTKLNTDVKINNAQVYFIYKKSKGADDVWIRRAYLYVDYSPTPAGQEYTREVSQSISMTGVSYRLLSLYRDFSQGLSITSDSVRTWSLSRVLSQTLSLASNTIADVIQLIKRSVALGVTLTTSGSRSWSLLRDLAQSVSLIMSQPSEGGFLLSMGIPGDTASRVHYRIINEFNTGLIMLNILSVLTTGGYFLRDREYEWGAVTTVLWFTTALAMLANNPRNWIIARVYGIFGTIFIVFTIVSVIKRLNPEENYLEEWGR